MSDAAVASVVAGAVNIVVLVVGFLTMWVKLRYGVEKQTAAVARKVDENTTITRQAGTSAVMNAATAAEAAAATAAVADRIDRKLNGGIDAAVAQAIDPVRAVMTEHTRRLDELEAYIHKRNHDLLSIMQAQLLKMEAILLLVKRDGEGRESPPLA